MDFILRCLTPKRVALYMYVAYLIAGVVFLFWPSNAVRENAYTWQVVVWHIFLIVGSGIAILGNVRSRIIVEVIGAPLMIPAIIAYVLLILSSGGPNSGARFGVAWLLIGGLFGLLGRVAEAVSQYRIESTLGDET